MRVGYIEFNHRAYKFVAEDADDAFFNYVSEGLKENASNPFCDGFTNYQHPLEQAMAEFETILPASRPHTVTPTRGHLLFITDGVPTRAVNLPLFSKNGSVS